MATSSTSDMSSSQGCACSKTHQVLKLELRKVKYGEIELKISSCQLSSSSSGTTCSVSAKASFSAASKSIICKLGSGQACELWSSQLLLQAKSFHCLASLSKRASCSRCSFSSSQVEQFWVQRNAKCRELSNLLQCACLF